MFLRCKKRYKDGKEHLYWSIVENRRVSGDRVLQRHVLYLGDLNGRQEASWQKTIDLFTGDGDAAPQQVSLFPQEHMPLDAGLRKIPAVGIRLSGMRLLKPRQWGACWLGCQLWEQLGLDDFWAERLPVGRQGARWANILKMIAIYRLVSPGSEWRLHRHWFDSSAMGDLLGGDFGLAESHRLYECHDKLLKHKTSLFDHLTERWKTLFDAKFEVLLYDLTSNGLFYMGEAGYTPLFGRSSLPGKYVFGGYYYGTPPNATVSWNGTTSSGQYGFYFQADQMLYREPYSAPEEPASISKDFKGDVSKMAAPLTSTALSEQGLKTFNLLTFAPGNARSNVFPFYFQSGLVYTGLLPGRDADLSLIAFGYGAYTRAEGAPDRSYSAVLEGGYRFQINGWSYAQPFFQYIMRPDGAQDVQNAGILGILAGVVF